MSGEGACGGAECGGTEGHAPAQSGQTPRSVQPPINLKLNSEYLPGVALHEKERVWKRKRERGREKLKREREQIDWRGMMSLQPISP